MADAIASLYADLTLRDQGLNKGLGRVRDEFGRFVSAGNKGIGTVDKKFGSLIPGIGAVGTSLGGTAGILGKTFSGVGFGIQQAIGSQLVSGANSLASGLFSGITGAADLNESLSKVGVTFGGSAGVVTAAADELAARFGIVKQETLDAAASFGLIAQGAGIGSAGAAELSVNLAKLAADAASFYNVPVPEALEKIRSGLVGESEPLRAFGVLLSETAVQNEAVRTGLSKTTKGLSESAKVQARASLIQSGLAKATGDLARTMDSASNLQRSAAGRVQNALVSVGGAVLPVYQELLAQFNSLGVGIGGFLEDNKTTIAGWATTSVESLRGVVAGAQELGSSFATFLGSESGQIITGGVGAAFLWLRDTALAVFQGVGDALNTAGVVLRNWGDLSQIAVLQIIQGFQDIGPVIAWIGSVIGSFISWFGDNFSSIFSDSLNVTISLFQSFGQSIMGAFTQIQGFLADPLHFDVDLSAFNITEQWQKAMDAVAATPITTPPLVIPQLELDHTEIDRQISDLMSGITDREAARAEAKAGTATTAATDTGAAPPPPGTASMPGMKPAEAAAPAISSLEEFASGLQKSALSGQSKAAEQTASATERTAAATEAMLQMQKQPKVGGNTTAVAVGPA